MTTDRNGIILLDKPEGVTSFRSLGKIKKELRSFFGEKVKVGHTGTLDSFASGLLVVLSGKFTRFNPVFTGFDKSYEAVILFGTETATLDPGGEIVKTAEVPEYAVIEPALTAFQGRIMQRPPVFSAVHVDGERAYKLALKGRISELPERPVTVHSFEVISWESPRLRCRIHCSKGTYIRSIARDLGTAAGSCASLESLRRLTVGPFGIGQSINPDDFKPGSDVLAGRDIINMLAGAVPSGFSIADAKPEAVGLIKNGAKLRQDFFTEPITEAGSYTVFNGSEFFAYIRYTEHGFSYIFTG